MNRCQRVRLQDLDAFTERQREESRLLRNKRTMVAHGSPRLEENRDSGLAP